MRRDGDKSWRSLNLRKNTIALFEVYLKQIQKYIKKKKHLKLATNIPVTSQCLIQLMICTIEAGCLFNHVLRKLAFIQIY